jgi:polyketide synthase PksL/surfactin family lipopeptide synthetase A
MAHYNNSEKDVQTQVINLTLIDDDRNLNLGMTPIPAIQPEEFLRGLFFFLNSGEKFSILSRFNFKDIEYLKPVIKLQFSKAMEENLLIETPTTGLKKYTQEQMEETMLDIWKKVLGYEEINTQANFFEIGGTSLSALKLIKLIRENLCIDSSVTDLFQYSRLENLCNYYLSKQTPKAAMKTMDTAETDLERLVDMVSSEEISVDKALEEMSWNPK